MRETQSCNDIILLPCPANTAYNASVGAATNNTVLRRINDSNNTDVFGFEWAAVESRVSLWETDVFASPCRLLSYRSISSVPLSPGGGGGGGGGTLVYRVRLAGYMAQPVAIISRDIITESSAKHYGVGSSGWRLLSWVQRHSVALACSEAL